MIAQVFVDEQRVQRWRIEAGQEHADHDQQVDVLILHALGQVTVVVLEALAVHAEFAFEQRVVINNHRAQELFSGAIHRRHFEALIDDVANGVLFFIGGEGEDGGDAQRLVAAFLQLLQRLIVRLGGIDAAHREHGIEALVCSL
ncbi:hypothetical protein D3C84_865060 [compost metagenome]